MTQWESLGSGAASAGGLPQLPDFGVPFCDWLDLTFSPTESLDWLDGLLSSLGASSTEPGVYLTPPGGVIKHQNGKRWQRLSVSGGSLMALRSMGLFSEFLRHVSGHPHKVTRLDAALDLPVDAAFIVSELWNKYRGTRGVWLNALNAVDASTILGPRFDGVETGTFYAGNRRKNKITARVYDKQHEVYDRRKVLIDSRVRYEVTVKTDQPTLRDAEDPTGIFWHYASPALLPAPDDVPPWSPGNPYVWKCSPVEPLSAEDRIQRVLYGTGDLNAAMRICGDSVAMFELLLKLSRLHILQRASKLPDWRPSYEC